MKIELIPEVTFTLDINNKKVAGFRVEASWECFTKYTNDSSWFICFNEGAERFLQILGVVGKDIQIVAFSPNLKDYFSPPDAAIPPPS